MKLIDKLHNWIDNGAKIELMQYLALVALDNPDLEITHTIEKSKADACISRGEDQWTYLGDVRDAVFSIRTVLDSDVFGLNQVED